MTLVNLRDRLRPAYDVRIDRRTPWGNPFHIGPYLDRFDAVMVYDYDQWVRASDDPAALWIRANVRELAGKVLACWCAPDLCHGDVLAELALEPRGVLTR